MAATAIDVQHDDAENQAKELTNQTHCCSNGDQRQLLLPT